MLGRILSWGHLHGNVKRQFQKNSGVQQGLAFRQGGGLFHHEGLIRGIFHHAFFSIRGWGVSHQFFFSWGGWWSFIMGFSHQGCFSWGGWVVVFNQGVLSSGVSFISFFIGWVVIFRQWGLSSGWCLIKAVFCQGLHCVVFLMCGCKPNMSDQNALSASSVLDF